jgi:RNA polymerase sigma factor (sigma-70 family)
MGKDAPVRQDDDVVDGRWPDSLIAMYRAEWLNLVRLSYLLTGRRAVAEEVVQDAFIAVSQAGSEIHDPLRYLRTTVVNRSRSWGRRQQVAKAHEPLPPDPVLNEPDELWDVLCTLDPKRRAAIVLRYYGGMAHAEIAEILGCRPATVRTSIHRGLKQLRKEIDR